MSNDVHTENDTRLTDDDERDEVADTCIRINHAVEVAETDVCQHGRGRAENIDSPDIDSDDVPPD